MYVAIWSSPLNNLMLFHYEKTSRNPREGRCKNGNKTKELKIANAKSIEHVSAIHKLATDRNSKMERHKDVRFVGTTRPGSDGTEEVNFNKNFDHYKIQFFDMLSKFKDMWDGQLGQINAVKH